MKLLFKIYDSAFKLIAICWTAFWLLGKILGQIKLDWGDILFIVLAPYVVGIIVALFIVVSYYLISLWQSRD